MSFLPSIRLSNGTLVPAIGLGTFVGSDPKDANEAVRWILAALRAGYRHIDTASGYNTEKPVGEAIKQSAIPREEIFVTTKLAWYDVGRVQGAIDESLANAGLEYFDLFLVHWPQVTPDEYMGHDSSKYGVHSPNNSELWSEMEKVLASGKVKNIGVSNFSVKTLEPLLKTANVIPAINQIEMHPYLAQKNLLDYCKSRGITCAAYTPTGHSIVRDNETIVSVAKKCNVSAAQVILAWHLQRGVIALPKSSDPNRQKENIHLPTLSIEDMKIIDGLDRGQRISCKPGPDGKVLGRYTLEQLGW